MFTYRSRFVACASMCLLIPITSCGVHETDSGDFNRIEAGFGAVDAARVPPGADDTELAALLGRVVSVKGELSMIPEGGYILSQLQRNISVLTPDDGIAWIGCRDRNVLLGGMLGLALINLRRCRPQEECVSCGDAEQ